jgi:hypothetical protein
LWIWLGVRRSQVKVWLRSAGSFMPGMDEAKAGAG